MGILYGNNYEEVDYNKSLEDIKEEPIGGKAAKVGTGGYGYKKPP